MSILQVASAAAVLTAMLAIAVVGLAPRIERALLYMPDPHRVSPAEAGLAHVDERIIRMADGVDVIVWWAKARPGQPTLLYFHGNGGSLAGRAERIAAYQARGRGVFMMSYRGYGGSGGRPAEADNVRDGVAAYDALVAEGVEPARIVLYGESLGTGVAVQVAGRRPVAGVILDAPYTSIAEVGAMHYPWLPVRLLMRDRYDSITVIGNIRAPLLVLHGDADLVIPVEMGRRLYAAAPEPKTLAIIPGAGHADHYLFGSFDIVQDWLDRTLPTAAASGLKTE